MGENLGDSSRREISARRFSDEKTSEQTFFGVTKSAKSQYLRPIAKRRIFGMLPGRNPRLL